MLVHLTGMAGKAKARCELCNTRCSAALPIEPSWMKLRGQLIHEEKMTFRPLR